MTPKSTATKVGHGLAKVLGIKLDYRDPTGADAITRGESVFSVSSANTYVEEEPTSWEWICEVTPSWRDIASYLWSLFPFLHWIDRYNGQWLIGDLIAGITIGAVVVPQGMAYATLATLPVEFGLYTSFMGVLIYWFFATSKDITIGPVAVMSTVTGNAIQEVLKTHPQYKAEPWVIAEALAIIAGSIVVFLGLARLGWVVELISLASISAFMTGSALNIAVGQVPTLMGMSGFSNRESTYKVVINILTHFNSTKLDAALGFTALFLLYLIRFVCNWGSKRFPKYRKTFFFASTLRTIFVILLYTLISWLVNMHHRKHPKFKILSDVPRGFTRANVPQLDAPLIRSFANQLPASVIVLIIEHIAIAKSFGRVNNYVINPSQELVAIGVTNLLGPFLGAYPATGSFSRTAIKAKAGVRTPFAGVITAIVVLIAIYGLTAVFFYIPNAALAAVIIHAVGDLITPPNTVYQFWRISPFEVLIFFAGVIVTVFSTIEIGVYVTVSTSMGLYLFRAFKAKGRVLGRVKIHSVIGDHVVDGDGKQHNVDSQVALSKDTNATRNVFLPIEHGDGSNPEIEVEKPYPGVFIYRFSESFNYPNASRYLDSLTAYIFKNTRRGTANVYAKRGDRPWNNPGPRRGQSEPDDSHLPLLRAVILDFSTVNNVDITAVQTLIDIRNQLDRYAAPHRVAWHFACINNRWAKRALASAGFGYESPEEQDPAHFTRWKPIFSVAEIGGKSSYAADAEARDNQQLKRALSHDPEAGHGAVEITADSNPASIDDGIEGSKAYVNVKTRKIAVVQGINRPLFHVDLTSALQSAISNIERQDHGDRASEGAGNDMNLYNTGGSTTRLRPVEKDLDPSADKDLS